MLSVNFGKPREYGCLYPLKTTRINNRDSGKAKRSDNEPFDRIMIHTICKVKKVC